MSSNLIVVNLSEVGVDRLTWEKCFLPLYLTHLDWSIRGSAWLNLGTTLGFFHIFITKRISVGGGTSEANYFFNESCLKRCQRKSQNVSKREHTYLDKQARYMFKGRTQALRTRPEFSRGTAWFCDHTWWFSSAYYWHSKSLSSREGGTIYRVRDLTWLAACKINAIQLYDCSSPSGRVLIEFLQMFSSGILHM